MTPLPTNPTAVVLVDADNNVAALATNVATDLKVTVVRTNAEFNLAAEGKPFNTTKPETLGNN